MREHEVERESWEMKLTKEEEELYRQRVREALARPSPDKLHPRRVSGLGAQTTPSLSVVGGALQH